MLVREHYINWESCIDGWNEVMCNRRNRFVYVWPSALFDDCLTIPISHGNVCEPSHREPHGSEKNLGLSMDMVYVKAHYLKAEKRYN